MTEEYWKAIPTTQQVGVAPHSARNARFYLYDGGRYGKKIPGYWVSLDFNAEIDWMDYKAAGAFWEIKVPGTSRVTGTMTRGKVNSELIKAFFSRMNSWCLRHPEFTIEAEYCFPDGSNPANAMLVVLYGVTLLSYNSNSPEHALINETINFHAHYGRVFDNGKSLPLSM